ncbi:hypothetical protein SEA_SCOOBYDOOBYDOO_203 [Mycobacterium phage ScoobyDoobyDoo]|nr:hypothetical protein SEA_SCOOBYDOOBYDOO_203 [Mycobacterium phage ScoobyDoobyDoo]
MDPARVKEIIAQRRVMNRVRRECDERGLPYPSELIAYLTESNVNRASSSGS